MQGIADLSARSQHLKELSQRSLSETRTLDTKHYRIILGCAWQCNYLNSSFFFFFFPLLETVSGIFPKGPYMADQMEGKIEAIFISKS
jgi:hypothetical protein